MKNIRWLSPFLLAYFTVSQFDVICVLICSDHFGLDYVCEQGGAELMELPAPSHDASRAADIDRCHIEYCEKPRLPSI